MKILQMIYTSILILIPIIIALSCLSAINFYLIEIFGLNTFMVYLPFISLGSVILFIVIHTLFSAIEFKIIYRPFQGKIKWDKKAKQVFYHSYDVDEVRAYFNAMLLYRTAYHLTQTILPSMWIPNLFLKLFGMKVGKGVMMVGIITDPGMVEIGDDTLIGLGAALSPHILEKGKLTLKKIKIGKGCVIGGRSIIMSGVEIGDNSIVGTASLVTNDTKIPPNTVWAGVPAKQIRKKSNQSSRK